MRPVLSLRNNMGMTRRKFLFLVAASGALVGFRRRGGDISAGSGRGIIRPPAALEESRFVDRCVRCGNCMKVCITNGLQPVLFQSGLAGVWTPELVPEIGYCEYDCILCGSTCPTGAIRKLTLDEKRRTRLGLARIDNSLCIPWAYGTECLVCQEHCPIPQKAIKIEWGQAQHGAVRRPRIDGSLCVGCGICQNKCPVRPARAIKVFALKTNS